MGLQPEGLIEGWRERRSGSMGVDDEEPGGPRARFFEADRRREPTDRQLRRCSSEEAWPGAAGRPGVQPGPLARRLRALLRDRALLPQPATPRERAPRGEGLSTPIAKLAATVKNKVRTCAEAADHFSPVQQRPRPPLPCGRGAGVRAGQCRIKRYALRCLPPAVLFAERALPSPQPSPIREREGVVVASHHCNDMQSFDPTVSPSA